MNRNSQATGLILCVILFFFLQSCVSSHVFEDAQLVGEDNKSVEVSLARALYNPSPLPADQLTIFYRTRDIGTTKLSYNYGLSEKTDIGGGLDLPLGLHFRVKHRFNEESLHHLHAFKVELGVPIRYYFLDVQEIPVVSINPSYIYTYRHDDLLSASVNATMLSIQTNRRFTHIPGIAAGIHLGDEVRFTAGISYFNNFSFFGASNIQYFSVEASLKYDLPFVKLEPKRPDL